HRVLQCRERGVVVRNVRGHRCDRSRHRPRHAHAVRLGRRRRHDHQSAARRGAASRQLCAGRRAGPDRGRRLRWQRPAPDRIVDGLRRATRRRFPRAGHRRDAHAVAQQPARRQGAGRGRLHRAAAGDRQCRGRWTSPVGVHAHRHAAQLREGLAHSPVALHRRLTILMTSGVILACPCGEVYELKPEFAGRLLECPVCERHLRAGVPPGTPRRAMPDLEPAFDRDLFLLRERVLTISSKYEVWSGEGRPILYVERPTHPVRTFLAYALGLIAASMVMAWSARLVAGSGEAVSGLGAFVAYTLAVATFLVVSMSARPLRHVTVFRDDSRREVLLRIFQDQRVAVLARTYTVVTAAGLVLARLRKTYIHNVIRKRWYVETPLGQRTAMAIEDSIVLSLLRRILGSLFGLLRTNFLLVYLDDGSTGVVFGEFNR